MSVSSHSCPHRKAEKGLNVLTKDGDVVITRDRIALGTALSHTSDLCQHPLLCKHTHAHEPRSHSPPHTHTLQLPGAVSGFSVRW